ncbi:MAG: polyhydroxyalkanoate synthesis repressor PhaR [Proteobacteria bacterium]|nr:polyhydroxyalkanoate synthesis repressor PhaR [Pseudomonadota bacterium]
MSEPRVIKKYPNRRLYDTFESRYITLAEIRRLVVERTAFVVIDKKQGHEITRSILLQVISEDEQHGVPALTQEFLASVIRIQADEARAQVARHIEQAVHNFTAQQPRTAS